MFRSYATIYKWQSTSENERSMNHSQRREELILCQSWLRTVIRARIGFHEAVVEDLLAELTAEVLASEGRLQDIEHLQPWLYRIAIRKVANYKRRVSRERRIQRKICFDSTQTSEVDAAQRQPLELMLDNENGESLRDALDRLPPQERELLMLKYVHEWNYKQLEEHLGIGIHKITYRLRQARMRLRLAVLEITGVEDVR